MKVQPPTTQDIGAHITELDARGITPSEATALKDAVYRHKLVVIRDQELATTDYVAFAKALGTPQVYLQDYYHHPEHPEIFVSSNIPRDGKKFGVRGTGQYWHTDCSFMRKPLSLTMVYPRVLPEGHRSTSYIDMARIYRTLPDDLRPYVENSNAVHDPKWRYKVQPWDVDRALIDILRGIASLSPPAIHPAVIRHPVTDERILYVSEGFTTAIEGLVHEESERVLDRLFRFIDREEHIHRQAWRLGDILLWDNRGLIHRASEVPEGQKSESFRIGVYDELPFYVDIEALARGGPPQDLVTRSPKEGAP